MHHASINSKADVAERATIENWLDDSDVAILYGHGHYPDLDVHKLLPLTVTPICSPQALTGEHPLRTPEDLKHHMLLHDDTGEMYDGESFWDVWLKAANVKGVDAKRGARFSHAVLAFEAAMDAVGVVASMPALAAEDLAAGRLVTPFELRVPLQSAYYLVCEPHAKTRPTVAAFRDWLIAEAAKDAAIAAPTGAAAG